MSLQCSKKHSLISNSLVCRTGSNDLMLSVRHSRNSNIDIRSDVSEDKPCGQLGFHGTRCKQHSDHKVFLGSNGMQFMEEDVEGRILNHSNIFVSEDPRTDLVSDVHFCKNIKKVVDNLFGTINSDKGFSQDMAFTERPPVVQGCQKQPGTSRENNDLQPSYRHAVPRKLEQRMSEQCCRKEGPQKLSPNLMNHEGHGLISSKYGFGHQVTNGPPTENRVLRDTVAISNVMEQSRNRRISLPLECATSSIVNNRNSTFGGVERAFNCAEFCDDTNSLNQPRNRSISLPLECFTSSIADNRNSTFGGKGKTVKSTKFVADTNSLVQPRNRGISLPLECLSTSIVNKSSLSSVERTVNQAVHLNVCDYKENSRKVSRRVLGKFPSSKNNVCDKPSDRSRSEMKRKHSSVSVNQEPNGSTSVNELTLSIDKKAVELKSKKKCDKSKMMRHCSRRKLVSKKSLRSKQICSLRKKNSSTILLNTPGKSRQIQLIQNVHRNIGKSSECKTSDLGREDDDDMLSKLEDIFPLASVIQKPTRSLRSRTMKDNHTLDRKLSTEGIWTSVNSNLLT